jgi:hypothetical protein
LVDTPGFNNTHKGDADILQEIVDWLNQAYNKEIKLTGIVYLHRIFDNRMTGLGMKHWRMFRKLCGDHGLGSVVLATTQWSKVSLEEGESMEHELISRPSMWKTLIEKGAKPWRQDKDKASAFRILDYLVKRGRLTYLDIQGKMALGAKLEGTAAAAAEVLEECKQQNARFAQEMKETGQETQEVIAQKVRETQDELKELIKEPTEKQEAIDNERKLATGRKLSWAAWKGHEAVVKLLLATGKVDVDSKSDSGQTPLSLAADGGHEAVVKLLLATGKVEVDSKDKYGWTPLSWAAYNGHEAVVKVLLATSQVDIDSKSKSGQTPLSLAADRGHEAVVKLLLATGKV